MLKVLFVCTGNTCRSPMAEIILKSKARAENLGDKLSISSAGISVIANCPASEYARNVMKAQGLNLDEHIARKLLPQFMQEADIVLTMTNSHKQYINMLWPQASKKVFTISEFAGKSGDVPDPFGGSMNEYSQCANYLHRLLDVVFEKLVKLAG